MRVVPSIPDVCVVFLLPQFLPHVLCLSYAPLLRPRACRSRLYVIRRPPVCPGDTPPFRPESGRVRRLGGTSEKVRQLSGRRPTADVESVVRCLSHNPTPLRVSSISVPVRSRGPGVVGRVSGNWEVTPVTKEVEKTFGSLKRHPNDPNP